MRFLTFFFILLFFIFSGCQTLTPPIDWNDAQSIAAQISTSRDDSKSLTTFQGPSNNEKDTGVYLIRAWKYDNDDTAIYQIYIRDHYSDDSGFYGSVYDSDGNKLNTVQISREDGSCISSSCWFYTPLGINVDRDYLEKYKDSGFSVKLKDKTGENLFTVPSTYIKAFLDKVS